MKRWMYMIERVRGVMGQRRLDKLGLSGWELIAVLPVEKGTLDTPWVFKKEKSLPAEGKKVLLGKRGPIGAEGRRGK